MNQDHNAAKPTLPFIPHFQARKVLGAIIVPEHCAQHDNFVQRHQRDIKGLGQDDWKEDTPRREQLFNHLLSTSFNSFSAAPLCQYAGWELYTDCYIVFGKIEDEDLEKVKTCFTNWGARWVDTPCLIRSFKELEENKLNAEDHINEDLSEEITCDSEYATPSEIMGRYDREDGSKRFPTLDEFPNEEAIARQTGWLRCDNCNQFGVNLNYDDGCRNCGHGNEEDDEQDCEE